MKQVQVVAALIIDQDKVLIAQRQDDAFNGGWEFPGGKIESNETPEVALKREILEELELEIEVYEYLTTIRYQYPTFHLEMACYLCTPLSENIILNDHKAIKWIDINSDTNSINWVPADVEVFDTLKSRLV